VRGGRVRGGSYIADNSVLCFHFYLSVELTTRNSKTGTFTTLKFLQMEF
jgi:hypothetical protein